MRRTFFVLLIVCLALPMVLVAETTAVTSAGTSTTKGASATDVQVFSTNLSKGMQSDTVSDLQAVLKSDSEIYPEGLVTGYYGSLTEAAVKRLQARYSLPQTGVLDEETRAVIFPPSVEITVISPNGGEVWSKGASQKILWSVTTGPVYYEGTDTIKEETLPAIQSAPNDTQTYISPPVRPFFPRASVDLVKDDDKSFVYHVGTVDLYQSQYTWVVPARVSSDDDYRIRISVGGNIPCLYRYQDMSESGTISVCPMYYPLWSTSDSSDNPFSVVGVTIPTEDLVKKLKAQVQQVQITLTALVSQIQALKSLIDSL